MKINENCLPCLISQVIKVANITNIKNRDMFYRGVFQYLGKLNFTKTNPEIIGATFEMIKQQVNDEDPYFELRKYYNELFLLLILVLSIIPKLKTLISGLKILIN